MNFVIKLPDSFTLGEHIIEQGINYPKVVAQKSLLEHGCSWGICWCCVSLLHTIAQEHTNISQYTHHTNPDRDVPNEFCVLRNNSLSRDRKQATFLFIRANTAEEEVAALVVNNGGGMCNADVAFRL